MTPVIVSAGLFLVLQSLHYVNPVLSFGVAGGMIITSLALPIADRPVKPRRAALPPWIPKMDEIVKLINLKTGEVINADSYELARRGMPDGYERADGVSVDGWIKALRRAKGLTETTDAG